MTDKERLLLEIIQALVRPDWHRQPGPEPTGAPWLDWREDSVKVGALVICQTSGRFTAHPHIVGYVTEVNGHGDCTIRELGGNRLCRVSNEKFYVVQDMYPNRMFEGAQYRFYVKVQKAFRRLDAYIHLFGGLRFDGDDAVITVRERWGGALHRGIRSVPYEVRMKWGRCTTIKAICETLEAQGYGDDERFDYRICWG